MKKLAILFPFIFISAFTILLTCETNKNNHNLATQVIAHTKTFRILPLGDSRVEGATSNSVSYRYELWKHLVSNQWNVDFIGTQKDRTRHPAVLGQTFDLDHEGIGGFKTGDVLAKIESVLAQVGTPDVVLLGIGGNDLLREIPIAEAINNINETIDILQNHNENITVFIERIAPGKSDMMTAENKAIFSSFNDSITALAEEQSNETSKVIAVDMSENWLDTYFADSIHYNHLGAKEIAERYFEAIVENLKK